MTWKIRKPGIYAITCPRETKAIRTNKGRFWEVWFQKEPNFRIEKDKYGKKILVIGEKGTDHLREPYQRTEEYEIWYSEKLDDEWKVCIAYNKWSSVSERLRRDTKILSPRYGREMGVVVVYYKPEAADYVFKNDILSL